MSLLSNKRTFVIAGLIGVCLFIAFFLPAGRKINPGVDEDDDDPQPSNTELDLAAELRHELVAKKIIPDILEDFKGPLVDMTVRYGDLDIINGMEMKPKRAAEAPSVTVSSAGYWTLVMVDPDPPSPDNPTAREWLHWIVVNIRNNDVSTGETVVEYNPPTPPQGKHRYVFLLYKQADHDPIKAVPVSQRGNFKVSQWAKNYKLEGPMAVKYFLAQRSDA